jgi:hypothetical protein
MLPYLKEVGWSALGGGAILLLTAATLIVFAVRPPRNRSRKTQTTNLAPAQAELRHQMTHERPAPRGGPFVRSGRSRRSPNE